jgi:hypothetical protein
MTTRTDVLHRTISSPSAASGRRLRSAGAVLAGLVTIFATSTATDVALHGAGIYPSVGVPMSDTARLAPSKPLAHALALGGIGVVLSVLGAIAMWPSSEEQAEAALGGPVRTDVSTPSRASTCNSRANRSTSSGPRPSWGSCRRRCASTSAACPSSQPLLIPPRPSRARRWPKAPPGRSARSARAIARRAAPECLSGCRGETALPRLKCCTLTAPGARH